MFKAVLWDFGGVMTSSPFEAFNRFEKEQGLPKDFIRSINATNPHTNAWAQLESAEIDVQDFDLLFAAEARAKGHTVRGQQVLGLLSGSIRPEMVKALTLIKAKLQVGCITNNVKSLGSGAGMAKDPQRTAQFEAVMALFDTVIESSKAGIRKPDPRIYTLACETMGINPTEAIFLDDLGINLKPAKALGMTTIKVLNASQAIIELETHLQMSLR
ncbi:MAG: HAD-IA family hydrolase [Pseudomonadales bacterium]|jgi:putative hydrolase of the HAD superfamily|nr:HAD-IA family hydrolase [Pseudomonadales bacterium]